MKKLRRIIAAFLFLVLLSGCGLIDYFIYEHRDTNANILVLPNDYRLFGSNDEMNFVKGKQDNDPVVIDFNILQIGWDNTHIVYLRRDVELNVDEYGVFNTETAKKQTFESAHSLKKYLEEIQISEIVLTSVEELMQKKSTHPN